MHSSHRPSFREDAAQLALIAVSALVAFVGSALVVVSLVSQPADAPVHDHTLFVPSVAVPATSDIDPSAGADRMFARVITHLGGTTDGYIQWGDGSASWADHLRASRPGGDALAGLRFGQIARIYPNGSGPLTVELKSGERTEVTPFFAVPGYSMGGIVIESVTGGVVPMAWQEIASIEFSSDPADVAPASDRIHGTLVHRSGVEVTGYVTWDLEKAYLTDALNTGTGVVEFAMIETIQVTREGATAVLRSGETVSLSDEDAAGAKNRGIIVSDPALGSIDVPWQELLELRLHEPRRVAQYDDFRAAAPLRGTVHATAGVTIEGQIRWDRDESQGWQMLDGMLGGVSYHVELAQVAEIEKSRVGVQVTLRDGRSFYLSGTNDVNWFNKGIEVEHATGSVGLVPWDAFRRVRFDPIR